MFTKRSGYRNVWELSRRKVYAFIDRYFWLSQCEYVYNRLRPEVYTVRSDGHLDGMNGSLLEHCQPLEMNQERYLYLSTESFCMDGRYGFICSYLRAFKDVILKSFSVIDLHAFS